MTNNEQNILDLLNKYNVPGGRYTYYPFHSKWNNLYSKKDWMDLIRRESPAKIDLYIHIPFCHSLCTFCGCNIKVMKSKCDNEVYFKSISREWSQYDLKNSLVDTLYIGGGTPNFLAPNELQNLLNLFQFTEKPIITIELDPRYLSREDLIAYKEMGISRLSIGIQDIKEDVLLNVNRAQNIDEIYSLIKFANSLNFDEINLDFIYGLNFQTFESFKETLTSLKALNISDISLYPFAKVPWQNNTQKAFGEIPDFTLQDLNQFQVVAYEALSQLNLHHIGMGHYKNNEQPYVRNISGFTKRKNDFLIGLGVSAISSTPFGHLQNDKIYNRYLQGTKEIDPVYFKSHKFVELEFDRQVFFAKVISENFISDDDYKSFKLSQTEDKLQALINDKILLREKNGFAISSLGRFFHKTILQFFDPNFIAQ